MAQFGILSGSAIGNEILQVTPIAGNGLPAASTAQVNTFQVAQTGSFGAICTTALALTNQNTLTQVPGMTVNVNAGATYMVDMYLSTTASAGGGIAVNLGQGTSAAATFTADTWMYNGTTVQAQGTTSALTTSLPTFTGLVTAVTTSGSFICTKTGTLAVFVGQNTGGTASTTTVNVGSYINLTRFA